MIESKFSVVVAPDSFKGSLTAVEVAAAITRGLQRSGLAADIRQVPMADGGEGTVDAVLTAVGGERRVLTVTGPMGEPVEAFYGVLEDGTAVIEMAAASGLPLVPEMKRNPLQATSYGTGELIRDALDRGSRRILLGIGGSATNDGGMGMAQAIGVRFIDAAGRELATGGQQLERIERIDASGLHPRLAAGEVPVTVCCDVTNPLCGPNGASAVYGPQKGATPAMVERLDKGLDHYAVRIAMQLGLMVRDVPGAGAAGGLGAGLLAFCRAELKPGIREVTALTRLEDAVASAQLVVTGEGRTDAQTAFGKVPAGVAALGREHGVPVLCLSGGLGDGVEELYAHGITALFSIANRPLTLDEAMREGAALLEQAAENIGRLYAAAAAAAHQQQG
ncbi:glycerate kinase family protein [Paenibacillus koleovorans]|uniref:glycerate kinase family protein n=1 Tax=Paenibacillus koleovorans TaxID=121608 RepID=UPI000FD92C95|nr:glycerate kinase [Paenibacillus koleovorans]